MTYKGRGGAKAVSVKGKWEQEMEDPSAGPGGVFQIRSFFHRMTRSSS